jgi:hypothetical protein
MVRKNPQTLINAWLTKRYHYIVDFIEVDAPFWEQMRRHLERNEAT